MGFLVGMVVFLLINLVKTPPRVSIPRDRGVTSRRRTSVTSPASTPPWMAAPIATASSGLTDLLGARPKTSLQVSCTLGILDIPPTRINSILDQISNNLFKLCPRQFHVHVLGAGCVHG